MAVGGTTPVSTVRTAATADGQGVDAGLQCGDPLAVRDLRATLENTVATLIAGTVARA